MPRAVLWGCGCLPAIKGKGLLGHPSTLGLSFEMVGGRACHELFLDLFGKFTCWYFLFGAGPGPCGLRTRSAMCFCWCWDQSVPGDWSFPLTWTEEGMGQKSTSCHPVVEAC